MSKSGYIDLKVNGRLFPTWILMNFKKYKLPEIIREKGEDPCAIKTKEELRTYQDFLANYLSYKSPFKDILIYHGLGSGKTCSSIAIAEGLKNNKEILVFTPASLRDNYIDELKKCGDFIYMKNQFWEFINVDLYPDYLNIFIIKLFSLNKWKKILSMLEVEDICYLLDNM